jgi:ABC-type transport system involved in cytochrome bd biosynthesis fused ATPase/permease subunit
MKNSENLSNDRISFWNWFLPPVIAGLAFLVLCVGLSFFFEPSAAFKIGTLGLSLFGVSTIFGTVRATLGLLNRKGADK